MNDMIFCANVASMSYMLFAILYLMTFFGFGKKTHLGIDIGTASIKIVELEVNGGRPELKNYGIFQLESADEAVNVAQDGSQSKVAHFSDDDIVAAIKDLIKRMGSKSTEVAMAIQSFSTFSTIISMPYLSEDEIDKAIPYEARKYVPLPLESVVLDWSIASVNKGGAGQEPSVEVFLVAVPKTETKRYQEIAQKAGLQLKVLELENSALIRALVGNDLSPFAIVNIGGRSTSILIVDGGVERVSHNYEVGGFEITKAIASSLKVSLRRAEELKRSFGVQQVDNNVINSVMSSLLNMMVFETKKTIHSYEEQRKRKIAQVFLVGGMSNMPKFVDYFSEKLGMAVAVGNPLARVGLPKEVEPLSFEINTKCAVALGLAMRDWK